MPEAAKVEAAAVLAAACASCPALQHLDLARCPHVQAAALCPLSALHRLRSLSLRVADSGPVVLQFAQQLPQLQRLSITTPLTCVAGTCVGGQGQATATVPDVVGFCCFLCSLPQARPPPPHATGISMLMHLTSLDLDAVQLPAGVCTELALLTGLRHLGLAGGGLAASLAQHLTALSRLTRWGGAGGWAHAQARPECTRVQVAVPAPHCWYPAYTCQPCLLSTPHPHPPPTSVSLDELSDDGAAPGPVPGSKPAELLAALLAAGRSGGAAPQLRRVRLHTSSETTPLHLSALTGLESLDVRHVALQASRKGQRYCRNCSCILGL